MKEAAGLARKVTAAATSSGRPRRGKHWRRSSLPDLDLAAAIIARCAAIEPRLRGAAVIGHRVGLRPTRPEIRVEAEQVGGSLLIHNYGHGGAGVTVSWGCAAEVATLALGL
jgi:D-amino-acid oxidase